MKALPVLLSGLVMLVTLAGVEAGQSVDLGAEGAFGFRASVEGESFEARFGRFEVAPQLNEERQPQGLSVEIDMADIDSGNADRDAEMQLPEWFDSAAHPVAGFRAAMIRTGGRGRHIAEGELQIKGVTRPVEVPFFWVARGNRLELRGEFVLDRRWFGVGPEDDGSVAASVTVFFDLAWEAGEN